MSLTPFGRAMSRAQDIMFSRSGVRYGAQTALAKLLDVRPQAVSQWLARGYVPPERAAEVESLTGVPRKGLMDPELVELVCPTRR